MGFYYTLAGIAVMLFPDTIISKKVTITMQSVIWHGAMITLGIYLIVTIQLGQNIKELISGIIIFCILTFIAITMNYVFEQIKTTYKIDASFNLFLISPYYESNILVL